MAGFAFFLDSSAPLLKQAVTDEVIRPIAPEELLGGLAAILEGKAEGARASAKAGLPGKVNPEDVQRVFKYAERVLQASLLKFQARNLDGEFLRAAEEQAAKSALAGHSAAEFSARIESLVNRYGAINFRGSLAETWYRTVLNAVYNRSLLLSYNAPPTNRLFPFLAYRTVGDDRVRPEHSALDGLVAPTDWRRWPEFTPPLGYNCRCRIVPVSYVVARELGWIGQEFPRGSEFLRPRSGKGGAAIVPGPSPGFQSPLLSL